MKCNQCGYFQMIGPMQLWPGPKVYGCPICKNMEEE